MGVTIQRRRDTAARWTAADTVLAEGEYGLELDTGLTKVGDGVTPWTQLPYREQAEVPEGTADGQTLRWDDGGAGWEATSNLVIDSIGDVYIGSTPDGLAAKLKVNHVDDSWVFAVAGSTYGLRMRSNSASGEFEISGVDDTLSGSFEPISLGGSVVTFRTGGTADERMRITGSGYVGITNTNPSGFGGGVARLAVGDESLTDSGVSIGSTDVGALYFGDSASGDDRFRGSIEYHHSTNHLSIGTDAAERMRIYGTGQVSIGTTAANDFMTVQGNSGATTIGSITASHMLNCRTTGDSGAPIFRVAGDTTNGDVYLWNGANNKDFVFGSRQSSTVTESMRIDSSGNVLIGATALPSASSDSWGWDNSSKALSTSRQPTTTATHWNIINGNGVVGSVQTAGSATTYNTTSDERLKINYRPVRNSLQHIQALVEQGILCEFQWEVEHEVDPNVNHVAGFKAQSLYDYSGGRIGAPGEGPRDEPIGSVYQEEITEERQQVDENGDPMYDENGDPIMETVVIQEEKRVTPWGVDATALLPYALKAIDELRARLEVLEGSP